MNKVIPLYLLFCLLLNKNQAQTTHIIVTDKGLLSLKVKSMKKGLFSNTYKFLDSDNNIVQVRCRDVIYYCPVALDTIVKIEYINRVDTLRIIDSVFIHTHKETKIDRNGKEIINTITTYKPSRQKININTGENTIKKITSLKQGSGEGMKPLYKDEKLNTNYDYAKNYNYNNASYGIFVDSNKDRDKLSVILFDIQDKYPYLKPEIRKKTGGWYLYIPYGDYASTGALLWQIRQKYQGAFIRPHSNR